ncbi:hypothetical protein LINPERHAP2_LOCUS38183, partial [Linum perenne]
AGKLVFRFAAAFSPNFFRKLLPRKPLPAEESPPNFPLFLIRTRMNCAAKSAIYSHLQQSSSSFQLRAAALFHSSPVLERKRRGSSNSGYSVSSTTSITPLFPLISSGYVSCRLMISVTRIACIKRPNFSSRRNRKLHGKEDLLRNLKTFKAAFLA